MRELRRIQKEELEHRASLEHQGVQDPSRLGVSLPRFRLGLIERETEEYDERVRGISRGRDGEGWKKEGRSKEERWMEEWSLSVILRMEGILRVILAPETLHLY